MRLGFRADWEDCQYRRVYYQSQFFKKRFTLKQEQCGYLKPGLWVSNSVGQVFHFVDNHWFWFSDTSQSVNHQFQFFWMQKTEFKALVRVISKPSHKPQWFYRWELARSEHPKEENLWTPCFSQPVDLVISFLHEICIGFLVGLELLEEMAIWTNTHPHGNVLQGFFNHNLTHQSCASFNWRDLLWFACKPFTIQTKIFSAWC